MEASKESLEFLRADLWEKWNALETDQKKKKPRPPFQKPYPQDATRIDLVAPDDLTIGDTSLIEAISYRKSRRAFTTDPLTLEELSFLLWATQGIHQADKHMTRTVPSAGARHPFETYVLVNRISELQPGLYRYLSLEHQLCSLKAEAGIADRIHDASHGQYVKESAVTLIWTAIPYRTEWRYSSLSPKLIALDAGHVCQNLYLACESIGAGTCAIGAYNQKALDEAIGVDGKEEFAIYLAPVGKAIEDL